MLNVLADTLFLVGVGIMVLGNIVISIELRKLLRQIRKLAALYPPFSVSDEDSDKPGTSSVFIDKGWSDETPGRD